MNCLNLRPSSRIDNKNHFLIQTTRNSTQATKIVSHPYICVDQGVLQDSVFTDCPYPRPREPWWFYPWNLRDSPGFARHLFQGKADGSGIPSTPPPLFFPYCPYPRPREPWWFYPSNLRDSPGFARHLFQGKADGSGIPSTPPPPPFFSLTENYIISNWKLKV